MRGEHNVTAGGDPCEWGSSPHARGALGGGLLNSKLLGSASHARGARNLDRLTLDVGRIIPACAGSTDDTDTTADNDKDHPRMRGEH